MSAKPVICQLLHGMKVGGAEILAARIARQLRDRYEFHFLCLDWLGELGEELQSEGFDLEVMERKGRDWKLPFRLARRLRKHRTGLILAHQYTPFFYALACRMFYWGVPIVFLEHGRHIPDYPRRKRILFNRLMLRRRDRIVADGEDHRRLESPARGAALADDAFHQLIRRAFVRRVFQIEHRDRQHRAIGDLVALASIDLDLDVLLPVEDLLGVLPDAFIDVFA